MALRSIASDLVRLLDAASGPVYVLDDQRRILLVNDACVAWAGYSAGELVGQESRYHSSAEVTGSAGIAAALAPPPEVWSGERASAVVSLAGPDGGMVARQVEFVPLGSDAIDVAGVMAFAAPQIIAPVTDVELDAAAEADSSPRDLHQRLAAWRRKLGARFHIDRLVGESPTIRQVRSQVEFAAGRTASVTVVGPVGSGRAHVARAIHYGRAATSAGPLVPLACPLLSVSLLESSWRSLQSAGAASGPPATLVLSDVDLLPDDAQEFLARSLKESRSFRIVTTARESLTALAAEGKFRPDLACALATVEIRLPRLAERLEDLPLLAQMFVEEQNRSGAKQIAGVSPEALDRMAAYAWPQNVAELVEVIATAHASAEGARITPADLPAKIQFALEAAARPRKVEETIVLEEFLGHIEEELIRRALARAKGNKTKAARLLGMTRPRLYRRLVQLGFEEPEETPDLTPE